MLFTLLQSSRLGLVFANVVAVCSLLSLLPISGCGGGGGGGESTVNAPIGDGSQSSGAIEVREDGVSVLSSRNEEPIFCSGASGMQQVLLDEPTEDLLIDGGGREVCLRLEQGCTGTLRARSLTLTNCRTCIGVADNAHIRVSAEGSGIFCDSSSDAIQAARGGVVELIARDDIVLISTGRAHGIRTAEGGQVSLSSSATCLIEGHAGPIRADGGAIDLSACRELIQVPDSVPQNTGPALPLEINDGTPLPENSPAEAEGEMQPTQDTVVVADGEFSAPLTCNQGTLLFDEPEADLQIDGEGRDRCILVERGCSAEIRANSITLVNCRGCVEASRSANVLLEAVGGNIHCEASRDAVRAETGSEILLNAAGDISVTATGSSTSEGLRALGGSSIRLEAPGACQLTGVETAVLASDDSSIELTACGTLIESPGA